MTGGPNRPVDDPAASEAGPGAAGRRDDQGLVADSRFLAYVLRHNPQAAGLHLDEAGWIDIDVLLATLAAHGRPLDTHRLDRLVHSPGKGRFQTHDGRIRAAQGHSIPVDLDLPPATPPDLLYHGTVERRLPRILAEGLQPMGRHHVHLSPDPATARGVGARRGRPVVLTIAAGAMHAAGHTFYQAANGVWLTAHVPPTYLTHIPG
jgi:putative RNA 2'-phosphotransferase